jgi:peroxiredoxin Q/BCP
MTVVQLDQAVPDFQLPSTNDSTFSLSAHKGKNIVIYFYPKDNTPGCTLEGQNFRDHIAEFEAHDTLIFGVSRDSIRVHENFKAKQAFPFELLSDADEEACKLFDVLHLKRIMVANIWELCAVPF